MARRAPSPSAPRPTRTSPPKAATGSPAAASRRSRRAANPFHIVTRGPLIVRDVDVLAEAAVRARVSVSFSVPTLDEDVWRRTEPGTAPPRQRLRALSVLRGAGIDAGVAVAPVLPGISDGPHQLSEVVRGGTGGGRDALLGERRQPPPGDARALPLPSRRRLAGARAVLRAALRRARVSASGHREAGPRSRGGSAPGAAVSPREDAEAARAGLQLELL